MAKLLGLRVKNFKAFEDLAIGQVQYGRGVPLPQFACFIGPNGSGKSSLLDVFGFIADCMLEGVELACDKPHRGGFDRLRTQGARGPITFELFFEDDDPARPIVYDFQIDRRQGVPIVVAENLRQRRQNETRGKPYYFLKLEHGVGKAWEGNFLEGEDAGSSISLADLNRLGLTTLGNLAEHPRIVRLREYVQQWYLSYFVPDAARKQPPAGPQRWLDREGANIANVLQYFQRSYGKQFKAIVARIVESIPGLAGLAVEVSLDKRLLLRFNEAGYADPFYQQSMSDGTLKMLAYALLLADPSPRPFIGIEEPENGLYIELIEHLARLLVAQTAKSDAPTQIFVTTHLPYFVDALQPEQVWIMRKDDRGRSTATRVADLETVVSLSKQGIPLGAQWYSRRFDAASTPARARSAGLKPRASKRGGRR